MRARAAPRWIRAKMFSSNYKVVLSPCIGVCELAADGLCTGCLRTSGEIAAWSSMGEDERLRLMTQVLPEREAQRA